MKTSNTTTQEKANNELQGGQLNIEGGVDKLKVEKAHVITEEEQKLVDMGLSLKEAQAVIRTRSHRTESIAIRVTKAELEEVNKYHDYLVLHGYINEGKSNLLVWFTKNMELPKAKQLKIEGGK